MDSQHFLETAFKHLPGGLILIDLQGKVRALNETGRQILGLSESVEPGTDCEQALRSHPKIAKILLATCQTLQAVNRQELTTVRQDGEKIVLGYGTLVLKDNRDNAVGVGMSFQDITRLIPLMDAHQFLDIALKNLPGGLIFVDLQGKVRGINQMAQRLLSLREEIEPGTECHKAFADHPKVVKVLLSTCQSLMAVNRQELTSRDADGEKLVLGYGTLILKNPEGRPIGVGMTFQDITRYIPLPLKTEFIRLVDRFFTPFAFIIVLAALFLGYAETAVKWWSVGLLAALVLFNEVSVALARKHTNWAVPIGNTRLITNFLGNVVLVYLLGTFWGPMWLLFVLTPVATALYADWQRTIITSVISAAALLGIYAARGLSGAVGWGQASLHAAFIVFISLFVNSIARLITQIRSSSSSAQVKPAIELPTSEKTTASPTRLAA
jgi:PAS domain S-box-containing protein